MLLSLRILVVIPIVLALFLAFLIWFFEVPVAIVLLCWSGVTTPDDFKKKDPTLLLPHFYWYATNAS